ncbi:MAG: DUF4126 domain-containing protein [Candidatus Coatesbacteria bacterium]|nr:DUF4126 domain-containing protein [Candidatus Coatesbacteria bacterium]
MNEYAFVFKVIAAAIMGFSLSACAGIRAFLPLAAVSIASKFGSLIGYNLPLTEYFTWLSSWPSVICFTTAVIIEIIADKFPAIDNILDAAAFLLKPIAGAFIAAAVMTKMPPLLQAVLAIIIGGGIAEGVHLIKAGVRGLSTVGTAGTANTVISIIEDIGSTILVILSFVIPILSAILIVILFIIVFKYMKNKKKLQVAR